MKRAPSPDQDGSGAGKRRQGSAPGRGRRGGEETADNLKFEDPFPDEEEEEEIVDAAAAAAASGGADGDSGENEDRGFQTYVPGRHAPAEEMDYDSSAYVMFHAMNAEWPCMSFDIVRDSLGMKRTKFPMTSYMVAGSQAQKPEDNQLYVMRLSDLHRTTYDDEDDLDEEDGEAVDEEASVEVRRVPLRAAVNRVRCMPQQPHVAAVWSELGTVSLFNLAGHIQSLDGPPTLPVVQEPVFTFDGHRDEGFAVDWSPLAMGRLVTGDCANGIYVWDMADETGASWAVQPKPFTGHSASVEDLQWNAKDPNMFASCSVDRTVKLWDVRVGGKKRKAQLSARAHDSDVNVISFNPFMPQLLASGGDDGVFKVWDVRKLGAGQPAMSFKWHQGPITSLEWSPDEESVIAVSGEDDQITLWDLSVVEDEENRSSAGAPELENIPTQLLFIHQGQKHIKEVHFHPQLPGVLLSTAGTGFHIFKPAVNEEDWKEYKAKTAGGDGGGGGGVDEEDEDEEEAAAASGAAQGAAGSGSA